ncbi:MAG: PAS domain S-box protein [Cytophagaceae bacterium]|nr:PAS domain S-box protein [Cytophagaceae bacterium]MDW8456982.1 PAS domain S-box protein [Cytophagaceae bacterium]
MIKNNNITALEEELAALKKRLHELEAEEVKKEMLIQESELRLQQALEQVNSFALTIDSNDRITYCNTAFLEFTGWKKENIIGKDWRVVLSVEEEIEKNNQELSSLISKGTFISKIKRRIRIFNGEEKVIRFNIVYQNNAKGHIVGTTIIGEDITEKKKRIKALKEGDEQLKDLFENANDLIQLFELNGDIKLVNKAWKDTLDYTDSEINKLNIRDIIHPDHLQATLQHLQDILNGKKADKFETVFISKKGKSINVIGSVNVRYEKGKPVLYRGIFHDNTEHLRGEKAQQLYYKISTLAINSDNLETLLYNIHQELRELIAVNNFHVALYDKEKNYLNFPYYVDENQGGKNTTFKRQVVKGLTEYSLFNETPTFLYEEDILLLVKQKAVELLGPVPKIWIGVPLRLGNTTIGVLCVKSHSDRNKYKKRHLDLLDFISGQIAIVIERKRKEEKIIEQTARLNAIFESSSHLIWSVNKRRGLTSFNHNYADAIFKKYHDFPELDNGSDQPKVLLLHDKEYESFIQERYDEAFKGIPQHFETKSTDKNGNVIWRETYLNPIFLPDGRIEEVSGISHDITEKKRYELSLRESEEKFRNIFESFQDIYYRTDIYGTITMMSPSGCKISGYELHEIIGKNIADFYIGSDKQFNIIKRLLMHGSIKNYESKILLKDGSVIQCVSNIRFIYNNENKPIAIEGVAHDITSLKKASEELLKAKEIAEKSLKVKENFLANMSHEIRTPMNGMIGMIDLLSETPLNEEQKKYVVTIKKSSETLLRILNDILDLSKIEAGKMQLRPGPIDVHSLISKLYDLFSQQALLKNIELSYTIDPEVPATILADETRLLQILSNLTSNSIKFTDKGRVSVHVKLHTREEKKCKLKIEIADTGIGISKENLEKLFNSFSQIDNSSTKSYGGTGLGLAISKELCRMMNGEIGVESTLGEGSTFWFTFETEETNITLKNLPNQEQIKIKDAFINDKPYVLIVDDNNTNLLVASEILKKTGCIVQTANNANLAISLVRQNNYDVIFMDIQMPEMDGLAALKELKKLDKKLPPIVAMTAYAMEDDKNKFISSGFDDYIPKPIKSENLILKISQLLNIGVKPVITTSDSGNPDLLNKATVLSMAEYMSPELVMDMYSEFADEISNLLNESLYQAQQKDYEKLKASMHTLKGTAGTVGAFQIEALAKEIESMVKANNLFSLSIKLTDLQHAINEFILNFKPTLNHYLSYEKSIGS